MLLLGLASAWASADPVAPAKIDSGDNAWMLVCTALVLLMTGPGLALFYGGFAKHENRLTFAKSVVTWWQRSTSTDHPQQREFRRQ